MTRSSETLERDERFWEETRREQTNERKRWGLETSDWQEVSDWRALDVALETGERLVEIARSTTSDKTTLEQVLNALGEFWFDLRDKKSSTLLKNDATSTMELQETQELEVENDGASSFSAFAFFDEADEETKEDAPCEPLENDAAPLLFLSDANEESNCSNALSPLVLDESAAQMEARRFDEAWTRFKECVGAFLRTFVAWKDEFERRQRETVETIDALGSRLGALVGANGRVDVDALTNALNAGEQVFERVRATLTGANAKQIPAVLEFLSKHWRSVLDEASEKGVALRRWLENWTRLEGGIERFAESLTAWKNAYWEREQAFGELAALYRLRFGASRPNDWSDLENAIDVGTVVFNEIGDFWGREVERDPVVGEQFWRGLDEFWNELSDQTSATCDDVALLCDAWNEYPKRLTAFVEALKEPLAIEGGDRENAPNRSFNVAEMLPATSSDANEPDFNSQALELNAFIDWVYRFAAAQVESLQIENELGAGASVLFVNGRRDVAAAAKTLEELVAFDRRIGLWKFPLNVDLLRERVGAALANSFENGSKALFAERAATVCRVWEEFSYLQKRLDELTSYQGATFDDSKADAYLAAWRRIAEKALRCENAFQYWNRWNRAQATLKQDFPELVEAIRKREIADADVAPIMRYLLFARFADEVVDASETLRLFVGSERDRQVERFRKFDEKRADLTKRFVVSTLASRSPATRQTTWQLSGDEKSAMSFLQREIGLKRHVRSIRQILDAIQPILPTLKPCLLMSPLSVAQYMPADGEKRDVIIFDEASQIPVWDAVGAIARGSQLIVVGDSKQLPPTSFFKRKLDEEELGEVEVEETESILDECVAAHIPTTMLTWHYRSRRESLIAFSNRHYYDGKLQTFPAPKDDALGVTFRYVADGVYEKGGAKTNKPEAKALVNAVVARLRSPSFAGKSLGVVTFNEAQKHLIEDLLDEARRKYPAIESFFDESTVEPVFVKNLENVQGDERDVIYFSICYGPDAKGAISMNFGPLNVDGGERRLNVAITRAKEENVVFSSLRSADISLSRTQKKGPSDLKAFLEYAESGGKILAENSTVKAFADDFAFEREIAVFLRSKGYDVDERVGTSRRRVDLAVALTNEQTGEREYVAAIECDGLTYASSESARDRDILRAQVLKNLGWRTIRVWSTAWTQEREKTEAKLLRELQAAFVEFAKEREARNKQKTETVNVANASFASVGDELDDVKLGVNGDDLAPNDVELELNDFDLELDDEWDDDAENARKSRRFASALATSAKRNETSGASARPYSSRDYSTLTLFKIDPADREFFHDRDFQPLLKKQMGEIVATEAPITERLLFQRMRECWGFARAGSQIAATLRAAIPSDVLVTSDADGERVFWNADQDPRTYRFYRVSTSDSNPRDFWDVPAVELTNALKAAVEETRGRFIEEDVLRNALNKLGFQRLTQSIQAKLSEALRRAASGDR